MSLSWSKLRHVLRKEISCSEAEQAFRTTGSRSELLGAFTGPQGAVDWLLAHRSHGIEDEDALVRELRALCLADDDGPWMAVLFLGLWPTFEWVKGKIFRIAKNDQTCISAIWEGLLQALEKENLWSRPGAVKRLMYFIRKHADKDLKDKSEKKKLRRIASYEEAGVPKDGGTLRITESPEAWPAFSNRSPRKDDSDESEIQSLRQLLVDRLGLSAPNAELLIRHFVRGETLADLASVYGISDVACRQRCSRIKCWLAAREDEVKSALVTHRERAGLEYGDETLLLDDPDGGDGCVRPWMN